MVDLQPLCKRPRQATGEHSVASPGALQDSAKESLKLPARINLLSIGFRRPVRIQQQQGRAKRHKAHVTFGSRVKKLISMYVLLSSISYDTPRHRIAPSATNSSRDLNYNEVNELVHGTLNEMS